MTTTTTPVAFDLTAVAASIAGSPDPAALLTHLVMTVAARCDTAPAQGALLSALQSRIGDALKRVRVALLAAVGETPGKYEGFEVASRAGSRSVDYDRLRDEFPDAWASVVRVGPPTLTVRYTG